MFWFGMILLFCIWVVYAVANNSVKHDSPWRPPDDEDKFWGGRF